MLHLHTLAIVLHAISAIGVFIIGIICIAQSTIPRQLPLARAVFVLLILMVVFLVVAIFSHVSSLPTLTRIIFGGLTLLAVYMLWRAFQALSILREPHGDPVAVIDHIGFVLISLFDGFAIVSSIDLHAPGWLIAIVAIGAVAVGIYAINRRKKTFSMQRSIVHQK